MTYLTMNPPNDLNRRIFCDEAAAREHLEKIRWPDGAFCPHCGEARNVKALKGKSHRPGLYKCYACKRHFSVTVGTAFERSKVPLNKWLLAAHLMAASTRGVSAHQIHKTIGVAYKTAAFMMRRLREAKVKSGREGGKEGGGAPPGAEETERGFKRQNGPGSTAGAASSMPSERGRAAQPGPVDHCSVH